MQGLAQILSRSRVSVGSHHVLKDVSLQRFQQLRKVLQVPTLSGGAFQWEIVDFSKALPAYLEASAELRRLYSTALEKSPPTAARPWSAVIAFDEFVPGNKLQARDQLPQPLSTAWRQCRFRGSNGGDAALLGGNAANVRVDVRLSKLVRRLTTEERAWCCLFPLCS